MEEDVKKWLKKKVEESAKKENQPQNISPISKPIIKQAPQSIPQTAPQTVRQPVSIKQPSQQQFQPFQQSRPQLPPQPQLQPQYQQAYQRPLQQGSQQPYQQSRVQPQQQIPQSPPPQPPQPPKVEMPAKTPEERKQLISKNILLGLVAIIIIAVVGISVSIFVLPNLSSRPVLGLPLPISGQINTYSIALKHNGKTLNLADSGDSSLIYGIILQDKSTKCVEEFNLKTTDSTSYEFDENLEVNGKKLSDYKTEEYAFSVFAGGSKWSVELLNKGGNDPLTIYDEYPKLANSFSQNFDIPIINASSLTSQTNISGGTGKVHVELSDDWSSNSKFYCRFTRNYDPNADSSITECPSENEQCVVKLPSECNVVSKVAYKTEAVRNGRDVGCSFPLSKLTPKQAYKITLVASETTDGNTFSYFTYNFGSTIENP